MYDTAATDFLTNVPKICEVAKAAMEADLHNTIKSKAMKDTASGPDRKPFSVYNNLWE